MKVRNIIAAVAFSGLISGPVFAQDITFKFNNPSFGGNSFNSAHLLSLAEIQQQHQPDTGGGGGDDLGQANAASAAFIRQLENRLLASIATDLVNQITGAEPGTSDIVVVGDQQIGFERTDTALTVEITNLLTGGTTQLVLPTLLLDN